MTELLIGIASLVVGIVGTALTYRSISAARARSRIRWERIIDEVDKMSEHLRKKSIPFDYIVSWPNGGLIAADLLHTRHNEAVPVVSLIVSRTRIGGQPLVQVKACGDLPADLNDKHLLIVDDVIATGRTMEAALNYFRSCGVSRDRIYTAVFGVPEEFATFIPEYSGFRYNGIFQLPWGEVPRDRTVS